MIWIWINKGGPMTYFYLKSFGKRIKERVIKKLWVTWHCCWSPLKLRLYKRFYPKYNSKIGKLGREIIIGGVIAMLSHLVGMERFNLWLRGKPTISLCQVEIVIVLIDDVQWSNTKMVLPPTLVTLTVSSLQHLGTMG